jgi:MFS family permease
MVPATLATPFAGSAADRFPRERVLVFLELAGAVALAMAAAAVFAGLAEALVYIAAGILTIVWTVVRPTFGALMPSLATTPEELVGAGGVALGMEALGTLVGPVAAGVLSAAWNPGVAFAAGAGASIVGALLAARVRLEDKQPPRMKLHGALLGGLRVAAREPRVRLVTSLILTQRIVRGVVNVLIVVAAFRLLHAGAAWVGYLTAAMGAGGLLGAFASLMTSGRRLAPIFAAGLALSGLPLVLLAAWPTKIGALAVLGLAGFGNSMKSVGGFTLLQRLIPDELRARVLAVVWAAAAAGLGIGSVLAAPLIRGLGARGALVATGCVLPLLVALSWRRLVAIDAETAAPLRELDVIAGVPLFAPLSLAAKERVAARLIRLSALPGTAIIAEGDVGDRFYVLASGDVDVAQNGRHVFTGGPGYAFGEIALLRDVPRTATVTARGRVELYALERDAFLTALGRHARAQTAGETMVDQRLAELAALDPL